MNVASLELCKELYELSDWGQNLKDESLNIWGIAADKSAVITQMKPNETIGIPTELVPAYDLGYLIRKLPDGTQLNKTTVQYSVSGIYSVDAKNKSFHCNADTPEDAACKLCVELIKQGIIKP